MGDLSPHFSRSEFACKCKSRDLDPTQGYCGGKVWINPKLVAMLEDLRAYFSRPVTVHSGCRCQRYNRFVKGAAASQHVQGTAADVVVQGVDPEEVADVAENIGFGGVGRYDTFTHVDVRPGKARWDERKGGDAE